MNHPSPSAWALRVAFFLLFSLSACATDMAEEADEVAPCYSGNPCPADQACLSDHRCHPLSACASLTTKENPQGCVPGATRCDNDASRSACTGRDAQSNCPIWGDPEPCPSNGVCVTEGAAVTCIPECTSNTDCASGQLCQLPAGRHKMMCGAPQPGPHADSLCSVIIGSGKVLTSGWDDLPFPKPDPFVKLKLRNNEGQTAHKPDTYTPTWNQPFEATPFSEIAPMTVWMFDQDTMLVDLISKWTAEGGRWFMGDKLKSNFSLSDANATLQIAIECQ